MERRYTVAEIDQMRASLMMISRDEKRAEDQLRTYMLNGTDPSELIQLEAEEINRRIDAARNRRSLPLGSIRMTETYPGSGHYKREALLA